MTGTRAMETTAFGLDGTRDDRLHRGRNVVGSFLMQGQSRLASPTLIIVPDAAFAHRVGPGLQPIDPPHLRPHLLGWSGRRTLQRQGNPGDLPRPVRLRSHCPLLAAVPPCLQDSRRRQARRRRQASPEHLGLRRALLPPSHVALLGSPLRHRRRLVRQRCLVRTPYLHESSEVGPNWILFAASTAPRSSPACSSRSCCPARRSSRSGSTI